MARCKSEHERALCPPATLRCFSAETSLFATVRRRRSVDTPRTWYSTARSGKNFVYCEDAFAHLREGVLRVAGYREKPKFTSVTTGVCLTSVVDRSRRYCTYRLLPVIAPFTAGVNRRSSRSRSSASSRSGSDAVCRTRRRPVPCRRPPIRCWCARTRRLPRRCWSRNQHTVSKSNGRAMTETSFTSTNGLFMTAGSGNFARAEK
jgi:hypothetical protein